MKKGPSENTLAEKRFWSCSRNHEIFRLFAEGKDVDEISKMLGMKARTVTRVIVQPFFVYRLRELLNGKLFEFQLKKIIDLPNLYIKMRDRIMNELDKIPLNLLFTEFMKLMAEKGKGANKEIPTNMVNFIISKTEEYFRDPETKKVLDYRDMEGYFGKSSELEISPDELKALEKTDNYSENENYEYGEQFNQFDQESGSAEDGDLQMDKGESAEDEQGPAD